MLHPKQKSRKIRKLKTNTGINFSLTISKDAAEVFSGCVLFETVLSDGILFTSGCSTVREYHIKSHKINYEDIE